MYVRGYRFSALSPQPYLSNLLEIRGAVAVAILSAARARPDKRRVVVLRVLLCNHDAGLHRKIVSARDNGRRGGASWAVEGGGGVTHTIPAVCSVSLRENEPLIVRVSLFSAVLLGKTERAARAGPPHNVYPNGAHPLSNYLWCMGCPGLTEDAGVRGDCQRA